MNIDQRLHRAAHELREIDVDVPPLPLGPNRTVASLRRLGAPVATVLLFAVGVLATAGDVTPAATAGGAMTGQVDVAVGDPPNAAVADAGPNRQLSPLEELAMITSLRGTDPAPAVTSASADLDPSIPPGVS